MKLKAISGIMLTLLLVSMLSLTFNIQPVKASGTIYIRANGSVDPPTAPIATLDNVTYTFTNNIYDSIVVERDNIVVDGTGYTVQGTGSGTGIDLSNRNNVTIRNMEITRFTNGVWLSSSSNNSIYRNNITNNGFEGTVTYGIAIWYSSNNNIVFGNTINHTRFYGIGVEYSSDNNSIYENTITNTAIRLYYSSNSRIYHNNFINNPQMNIVWSSAVWDDGYPSGGNCWSDYKGTDLFKGPFQNITGSDGIGDTPYNITVNNQDRYPLVVTIQAYCYAEGTPVSVSITMDGSPTGYNTPHTFTGLAGTHTFTVPSTDPQGTRHQFKRWSTGETSRTITVNTGEAYTAYYGIDRIRIGVIGPVGAIQGTGMFEGAQLAANWINGPGGGIVIGGIRYDIQLFFANENLTEMGRLITVEQVDFIVGGFRSENVVWMRELAMNYQKLFFICGAAANELVDCGTGTCGACVRCDYARYKYLFRVTFNQTTLLKNLIGFLKEYALPYRLAPLYGVQLDADPELDIKTAVIAENLAWTVDMYNAFVYGGYLGPRANIVYSAQTPYDETNFIPYLDAMHAREVRLVVHIYSAPNSAYLISQAATHPLKAIFSGIDVNGQDTAFWRLTGGDWDPPYGTGYATGGCQYETLLATSGTRTPASTVSQPYTTEEFWDLYYATYGQAPIYTSWSVYDAIIAMYDMLEAQARPTYIHPPFDTADADALVPLIEATDRESVLGRFKYTQYHDPFSNEYGYTWTQRYVRPLVVQWHAGRQEVVWPSTLAYSKLWALPDETGRMYPYPADVLQEGTVDIYDALTVQATFGSYPAQPNQPAPPRWQFVADVERVYYPNQIDVFDALSLIQYFGKSVALPLAYCNEAGHMS